jgi:hypothetical protein
VRRRQVGKYGRMQSTRGDIPVKLSLEQQKRQATVVKLDDGGEPSPGAEIQTLG